jgi:hypothetical protein
MHRPIALALCLVACSDVAPVAPDAATPDAAPETALFAAVPAGVAIELVPTTAAVLADCAAELGASYCTPEAALAAALACRARLSPDTRARCDAARGCLAPYLPTRTGACVAGPVYPPPAGDHCAAPVDDNCAYYRACLEPARPCGDTGYALSFGEPLCYLFVDQRDTFSEAGRRWLRAVRTCLQRTLAARGYRPADTCDALATEAFASHTECYTAMGDSYCTLPPADQGRLARMLVPYLRDPRVAAQVRAVTDRCAAR